MKKTPLYEKHVDLGAKMVDFAGWSMPLYYTSIFEEVKAVREAVGVFDVSHMGEILIEGVDTEAFVDFLVTNDFSNIPSGKAMYTVMCNERGGIIDDLVVFKIESTKAIMVVNAANIEKDFNWVKAHVDGFDVRVSNVSEETSLIAFQGPRAQEALQSVMKINLDEISYYSFQETKINDIDVLVSRTGYTGEDGFELMVNSNDAVEIWNLLVRLAGEIGGKPAGLGARDVCRLEAAYLLYGQDMDENTNPFEVGLSWVVKMNKNFIGKEALLEAKNRVTRKIAALVLSGRRIARKGYKVLKDGMNVGEVTSGNFSPTLNKSIALAFVPKTLKVGDLLEVVFPNDSVKAEIVKKPFYKGSVRREV
ncbi:glycine cleavage system aminomethyltransferase GcvT [Thermotoga sp. KOL6]|uniref:glycine cleavage system aminomethyltransferase GcvT n=1 Tax=Thermotoga sp. KOL6 TaxID=126741 RepID=UPI000C760765|nr:glycine cleavage system aminomethyltransferase GcvT [Thermotoga sp. KOL6]PLV58967.1 glycine cleavage system protein T [Thermotoga sp. KOL6]